MTIETVGIGISIILGLITIVKVIIAALEKRHKEIMSTLNPIKEACFFSLQAHVENGSNGDVKKAYERLKNEIFKKRGA